MNCDEYRSKYPFYSELALSPEVWETPEWTAWMNHYHDCTACSDWTLAQQITARGFEPRDFPCVHVGEQVTRPCDRHSEMGSCPDAIVTYLPKFDEYAIPVRDGGTSAVTIRFCPWCGTALPESKRNRWFEELSALGYNDPVTQDIPSAFLTDAWYKGGK